MDHLVRFSVTILVEVVDLLVVQVCDMCIDTAHSPDRLSGGNRLPRLDANVRHVQVNGEPATTVVYLDTAVLRK
jgi:hypothetical protein